MVTVNIIVINIEVEFGAVVYCWYIQTCACLNVQIQAVAHYDNVRLKSEKADIYIVTYPLPQASEHGEFATNWLGCLWL